MNNNREIFLGNLKKFYPEVVPYWDYVDNFLFSEHKNGNDKISLKDIFRVYTEKKILMIRNSGMQRKVKAFQAIAGGGSLLDMGAVMLFVAHHKTNVFDIVEHLSKEDEGIPDMTNKQMMKYLKSKFN